MILSNKLLGSLALLSGMMPTYCAGTARGAISTPLGDWGFVYEYKKINEEIIEVTTTIPPGFPGGQGGPASRPVLLPANPTETPMPYSVNVKDPIILQIPIGWTINKATITTPLGTGDVIVQSGNVPSMIQIASDGSFAYTDYFKAEPGYQIFFCDCPPGLESVGLISGLLEIGVPPTERRVDEIKIIETWKVTFTLPNGDSAVYYSPVGPYEHDFANVDDIGHTFVLDASTLPCTGPTGAQPQAELPANDWTVGSSTSVSASAMDPADLSFLLVGWQELAVPIPVGTLGCRQHVEYADLFYVTTNQDGTVDYPVNVPNDNSLVGLNLLWQPVQLDPPTSEFVTGTFLKVRIEP